MPKEIIDTEFIEVDNDKENEYQQLEELIATELPDIFTISSIAELCGCKQTTIRNIVQLMEKEGLLSTSNKEANSHRKLTASDFDAIRRVLELIEEDNLTYSSAISKIANERITGVEPSMKQVYDQSTRTLINQEKIIDMAAKLIEIVQEQSKVNNNLKEELDETKELLRQATECIQNQNKQIESILESNNNELQEFKSQHNEDMNEIREIIHPEKKKKFFGLF